MTDQDNPQKDKDPDQLSPEDIARAVLVNDYNSAMLSMRVASQAITSAMLTLYKPDEYLTGKPVEELLGRAQATALAGSAARTVRDTVEILLRRLISMGNNDLKDQLKNITESDFSSVPLAVTSSDTSVRN